MFYLFIVMLAFLLFQQSVVKTSVRLSGKYCNAFPVEFLHRFPSWNIDAPFDNFCTIYNHDTKTGYPKFIFFSKKIKKDSHNLINQ